MENLAEVWLRGPLPDVPALLQPIAHALLQAKEEVNALMANFPDDLLWQGVAGMASAGFHLQHMTGVLDRLFFYAQGESLSEPQLAYLAAEGKPTKKVYTTLELVEELNKQIDTSIDRLRQVDERSLADHRAVGRGKLPSTVIGLYTHAAEHTMRHLGQLLVTVRVLLSKRV